MKNKIYLFQFLAITFLCCFFTTNIYAQSNACADAISLTPAGACVNTGYSIPNGFTRDAVAAASCVTNANNREDGWFSFVATNTTSTITATTNRNVALAIYEGGCGALSEVGCVNAGGNNTTESLTVATVIGTTYLVRVIRFEAGGNNTMSGNICVESPLANDECTGAIDLPVGQFECTFGGITNVGATPSVTPAPLTPACGSIAGAEDVWYRFIAPAGGQVAIDTEAGSITDGAMALYHAPDGTCGSLNLLECDDDDGDGAMPRILQYNLIGGNTYYLRVWDFGGGTGTMDICIQNQYSDCEVSVPLCSSADFNTNSFGSGATDTNIGNCFFGADPTERQSVWINFEIQTDGTLQFLIVPQEASDDYDFILYRDEGAFCTDINANGTVTSCNFSADVSSGGTGANTTAGGLNTDSQNFGFGTTSINRDVNVLAGERYFLLINNFANSSSGFNLNFSGTADLDCTILPLELTDFRGEKVKDQNLLHWATAREYNTSHFEIERSNDAMDFIKIGELKSGNNSLENQIYQYWDDEPQNGINYYRLKQVDLDGTFTYTKTIAIDNQGIITNFELQKIYPNPAQNSINFVFAVPSSDLIQLEIFDSNGKSVSKKIESYQKGIQNFNQNLSSFAKGIYILRISNLQTGQVLTEKFVKN